MANKTEKFTNEDVDMAENGEVSIDKITEEPEDEDLIMSVKSRKLQKTSPVSMLMIRSKFTCSK